MTKFTEIKPQLLCALEIENLFPKQQFVDEQVVQFQ
jgi:hypothetical protein